MECIEDWNFEEQLTNTNEIAQGKISHKDHLAEETYQEK